MTNFRAAARSPAGSSVTPHGELSAAVTARNACGYMRPTHRDQPVTEVVRRSQFTMRSIAHPGPQYNGLYGLLFYSFALYTARLGPCQGR